MVLAVLIVQRFVAGVVLFDCVERNVDFVATVDEH